MQFNSYIFILLFLPLTVFLYYLTNKINNTVGKVVLLASSVVFYCYTDISIALILGISIVINYIFTLAITKVKKWRKVYLWLPIIVNVGLLLYYKYLNFAIYNISKISGKDIPIIELVVPIGISFFTFQQIAYVVSIYKGEVKENNLLDYLVFILYFPKILMGPLVEPVDFIGQINDATLKKVNWDNIANGIKIFSLGLFKKMMIADVFAKAVEWGFKNNYGNTAMDWLLVMFFYTFEIYFDFSGYSDMAVGSSIMLNITLPINFDSPYKAISIRDFWKRWHISLTKFFTKYIYIPMGGSRKGVIFTYVNTMIVFLVSGIWHGANWTFILWGLLHGIFSVLDRVLEKRNIKIFEPARWLCTFIIVSILWLLFRANNIRQWWDILVNIICFKDINVSDGLIECFVPQEEVLIRFTDAYKWIIQNTRGFWMNIYILAASIICFVPENNYKNIQKRTIILMLMSAVAFVWGVICLGGESVFVYFNF